MSEALELEDALMRTFDPKKPTPSSIANVSAEEAFLWIKDLLEITNMTLAQFRSDDLDDYIAHRMCLTLQQRYGSVLASAVKKFLMKCFDLWLDNEFDEVEKVLDLYCKLQLNFAYQNVVQELLETQITDHLQEAISGEYERIYMPELQEWFDGVIVPFLSAFRLVPSSSVRDNTLLENLRGYLEASYVRLRSNELFDMIASFPDSMIAIRELRDVANASNSSNVIGKVFGSELQRRLLHLGASTKQILDMYISVIRALRVLDPSDTLLNHVTKPVRRYLRDRKDTVRTIVSSLTQSRGDGEDGGASELHGELRRGGGSLSLGVGASDDEDEALNSCEEWRPAKRHPDITFAPGRGQDILALLVSIYGSTDLFVQEYRNLLSEKLIQLMDYDADIEISTLELLKIRFGEDALHSCEVMLHDLEVSRRLNAIMAPEVKKNAKNDIPIDFLIVSDNYWPALGNAEGAPETHATIKAVIEEFCRIFSVLKKPRKLLPMTQLGSVSLELDFEDGSSRRFRVSTILATMIMHISEAVGGCLRLSELSRLVGLEIEETRCKMAYWISKRVVCVEPIEDSSSNGVESDVEFRVVEEQEVNAARDADELDGGGIDDGACDSDAAQNNILASDAASKVAAKECQAFIRGMLSTHDSLPLERIHTMLRLVTAGSTDAKFSFDMNLVQFKKFMQTLCDSDVLEIVEGGAYRLKQGGI